MIIPAVTAAVLPRRVSFAENMDTKKEVFSLKGYSTSGSFLLTQCPLARDGGWSARGRMRARAREGVARDDGAAAAADAGGADAAAPNRPWGQHVAARVAVEEEDDWAHGDEFVDATPPEKRRRS